MRQDAHERAPCSPLALGEPPGRPADRANGRQRLAMSTIEMDGGHWLSPTYDPLLLSSYPPPPLSYSAAACGGCPCDVWTLGSMDAGARLLISVMCRDCVALAACGVLVRGVRCAICWLRCSCLASPWPRVLVCALRRGAWTQGRHTRDSTEGGARELSARIRIVAVTDVVECAFGHGFGLLR